MNKKVFRLILVIIWLIVIFFFSNQPGNVSKKQSEKVITTVVSTVSDKSETEKKEIVKDYTLLTRKIAHFLEYLILGILVIRLVILFDVKYIYLIAIGICIFIAIGDEVHQLFITERDCNFIDVIIDTSGSLLGIIIYKVFKNKVNID